MKKLFALAIIVAALASPKADASPLLCAPVVAGSAAGVSAAFAVGMAGFIALPIAIVELQDQHVWESVFPVVDQSYPGDKHFPVLKPVKAASNGFGKSYHVATIYGDSIRSDGF